MTILKNLDKKNYNGNIIKLVLISLHNEGGSIMKKLKSNKPLWAILLVGVSLIGLIGCDNLANPEAKDVRANIKNTTWVTTLSSVAANWATANAVNVISFTDDGQRVWLYNNTQSGLTSFTDPPFNPTVQGNLTGLTTPINGRAFYFDQAIAHGIIYNGTSPSTGTYGTFDITFANESSIITVNIGGTSRQYQITPVSASHLTE